MCKSLFVLIVGLFLNDVTSYNPQLTYAIRFKNLIAHPNISGDVTIDQFREKQFVNGIIKINSKLSTDNVVVVFHRCKLGGFDCEYFQTWKLLDLCTKLKQKNQVWSSWYSAFDPPMICPLNKEKYIIRNATIDLGPAMVIYPDVVNYQWKILQKFYGGDEYIGSFTIAVEYFGYRKRNTSILKV